MKELLSDLIGPVTVIIDKVVADKDHAEKSYSPPQRLSLAGETQGAALLFSPVERWSP
jgi:hypothetical protein